MNAPLCFHALRRLVTPDRVKELQALTYDDFLQTPYWRIVRAYVLHHQPACERCGMTRHLQVHHRSYLHHGREHEHWRTDLEVLCRRCHAAEHGKLVSTADNWRGVAELMPEAFSRIARGIV